jgi:hypothetical protein
VVAHVDSQHKNDEVEDGGGDCFHLGFLMTIKDELVVA